MSTTIPPLSHRFGAFWGPAPSHWACTFVGPGGEDCDVTAVYSDGDDNGACVEHAIAMGAIVKAAAPEACNCEQALALKADLREAAIHLAEALAMSSGTGATEKRDTARAWLTAYLARLAKEGT